MSFDICITIPGNPIPKARHRSCFAGKFVRHYDPQEKLKKEFSEKIDRALCRFFLDRNCEIENLASNLTRNRFFYLDICFYIKIPDSLKNRQKNGFKWRCQHACKPDLDNLAKFILDCSNGILFPDDSMICDLSLRKMWSDSPRTEIKIRIIEKMEVPKIDEKILNLFSPKEMQQFFLDAQVFSHIDEEIAELTLPEIFEKKHSIIVNALINISKYADKLKKIDKISKEVNFEK